VKWLKVWAPAPMMMPQGVESSGVAGKISHVGTKEGSKSTCQKVMKTLFKHGPNIYKDTKMSAFLKN
jgi:hypothetical protein